MYYQTIESNIISRSFHTLELREPNDLEFKENSLFIEFDNQSI